MLDLADFTDYSLESIIRQQKKRGLSDLTPANHSTKPGLLIVTKPFIPDNSSKVTNEELSVYNERFARAANTAAVDKDPGHKALKKAMRDPRRFLHHILAATNARNQYPFLTTQNRLPPLEPEEVFKARLVQVGDNSFRNLYLLKDWVFTFTSVFGEHLEFKQVLNSGNQGEDMSCQVIHRDFESITDGGTRSLINRRRTMTMFVGQNYPIDHILTRQATYWNEEVKAGTYA